MKLLSKALLAFGFLIGTYASEPAFAQTSLLPAAAVPAVTGQSTESETSGDAGSETSGEAGQEANGSSEAADPVTLDAAGQALIKVLEDPASRQALIDRLNKLPASDGTASPATGAEDAAAADDGQAVQDDSFAFWLGNYTRALADHVVDVFKRVFQTMHGVWLLLNGTVEVSFANMVDPLLDIVVVLAAAFGGYLLVRSIERFYFRPREPKTKRLSWGRWVGFLGLSIVYDCVALAVGAGAGQVAGYIFGAQSADGSALSLFESLAVNAFVIVGLIRIGLRVLFAPNRPLLRLMPLDDENAQHFYWRFGFLAMFAGFGLLLAVPLANRTVSFLLGNGVRFFVVACTVVLIIRLVSSSREAVERGIQTYAESAKSPLIRSALEQFAGVWHILSYLYIMLVSLIWISRPFDAVAIVLNSTAQTLVTILVGALVSTAIGRFSKHGVALPASLKRSLPMLERRLNSFVPRILAILRVIVFFVTLFFLLDIWGIFNFWDWLVSASGISLIESYGSAFMVLIFSFIFWLAVMSWVDFRLRERAGYVVTARVRTLFQLFQNAFTVIVVIMASLLMLSEIGIDIGPLIAGAGVVGLAISFGAQTLVKDIITGAFIQIENALNEGDVVTVANVTGVVERLTVRSVRLRDLNGTTHVVPFSSVDMVANFMRDYSFHVAVIGVSYDTNIKDAKQALEDAFNRLRDSEFGQFILGDLEVHGVTNFGASSIDIRVRIKTTPGDQWKTGRAYNEYIKEVFDERNIEIPFPHVTYQMSQNDGKHKHPVMHFGSSGADESGTIASGSEGGDIPDAEGR